MSIIGYLGDALQRLDTRLFGFSNSGNVQVGVDGNGFFYPVGSQGSIITLQDYKDFDNVYFKCSTLQTVIVNKSQCKINAKWDIYKKSNDKVAPANEFITNIKLKMAQPNFMQNYTQFRLDVATLVQIHGVCPIWAIPNGSSFGTGFQNIWALNMADLVIQFKQTGKYVYQNTLEDIIQSIHLNYSGGLIEIPIEQLTFVKDQAATKSTNGMQPPLFPTSRMFGMKMVLSNNMASYDARNSMVTNRGQTGFIANDTKDSASFISLMAKEKEDLQKELAQYGILRGQRKQVITDKNLKWVSTVMPTKDLMLMEESEETMCRIVDVYGYQVQLLATSKTSSIGSQNETQKEARKNLYQNTIIPEDNNELPAIFSIFKLDKEGYYVKPDYSHVEELQANETEIQKTTGLKLANITAINSMQVDYQTKLNIATSCFEISETEAKLIIQENASTDQTASENTGVQA